MYGLSCNIILTVFTLVAAGIAVMVLYEAIKDMITHKSLKNLGSNIIVIFFFTGMAFLFGFIPMTDLYNFWKYDDYCKNHILTDELALSRKVDGKYGYNYYYFNLGDVKELIRVDFGEVNVRDQLILEKDPDINIVYLGGDGRTVSEFCPFMDDTVKYIVVQALKEQLK